MKFNKKLFFPLIFVILVLGVFLISAVSDLFSDVTINRFDAVITINDQGDMTVVETWDMTYHQDFRVRFRDIDYIKFPEDYNFPYSQTNRATFDQTNYSVRVLKDGVDVSSNYRMGYSFRNDLDELNAPVRCEPFRLSCESFFIDSKFEGGLRGRQTFEYTYTIKSVVTEYSDISELNWVLFEYMEGTIKEGTIEIRLPQNSLTKDDVYIFGHGISKGNLSIESESKIMIQIEDVKKGEFLEFRVLMSPTLFPNISANQIFINDGINKELIMDYQADLARLTNLRILMANVFLGLAIATVLLLGFLGQKNYKKYFKPHETDFQGDYYRELPDDKTPAHMSYLYYLGKVNSEDVTATLLDLIRRKYLIMEHEGQELTSKDASFLIKKNKPAPKEALLPHEAHLIAWFIDEIGNGNEVRTKDIEDYGKKDVKKAESFQRNGSRFTNLVKNLGKNDAISEDLSKSKQKASAIVILPVILLVLSLFIGFAFEVNNLISNGIFIVSIIGYTGFISVQKRRTKKAQEEFKKWDAFKNFLLNFGNFKDYPMPGIIVWEHYLVYATSLKIADKVMEQLKVKLPMDEATARQSTYMGVGYGRRGFYYGFAMGSFNQSVQKGRSNSQASIAQARASSGGRGGGFSGGSSRGGGGGGGRSR